MCGIAGILVLSDGTRIDPAMLRRMAGALRHRGPDGTGVYLDDAAGLAHTRLAIIDQAGGAQPMSNDGGAIWIAFNGEVFNYVELRAELEALGHRFRTRSDTEVIIHAYEQWGRDAWARLNGQFSIALRDRRDASLWLVRDRVGITPLFYARTPGALVFGSEAKAIFASGLVAPRPDPASLADVFTLWSVPAPASVFAGVSCVLPGTALRFDRALREQAQTYHSLRLEPDPAGPRTAEDAADRLGELLARAVRIRLRADVPVGAYLSGGLDSSVVARLVRQAESSSLQTFSVRFADPRFDEGGAQERMARILGTTHHQIVATQQMLRDALPDVVRHAETPLLRTAPVPMFVLSSLVRAHGMRVVLTGEGADEFLGGYDIFKEDRIRRFWARRPGSTARPALLRRLHPHVADAPPAMWQEFFRRGLAEVADPFYSHRPRWENTAWALRFLAPEVRGARAEEERLERALPAGWRSAGPLARAQHLEIAGFMTPYLLAAQGDRMIMAHGVEGRYPYLDPDVVQFCAGLPPSLKLCGLREKVTLRALARRLLPEDVAARRKWPFRAPIAGALFGPDAPEYVRELLSPRTLGACPLIDARPAAALAATAWSGRRQVSEREEMALLGLLTLQLWHAAFIAGTGSADAGAGGQDARSPALVWEDRRSAPQPGGVA